MKKPMVRSDLASEAKWRLKQRLKLARCENIKNFRQNYEKRLSYRASSAEAKNRCAYIICSFSRKKRPSYRG